MRLSESQYDWVKIPTDLNSKNMVMVTAKTPHPTFHAGSAKYPVRLFTTQELLEASRSLAHRAIGLNHLGLIEGAFTIDAQYNQSTCNTEVLAYFPDEWIDKVRTLIHEGKESIFSITYSWRDERYTESGVEFIGLIFDQIDLLCGAPAGDKHVSAQLVESEVDIIRAASMITTSVEPYLLRHACMEAAVEFIGADKLQQSNLHPEKDQAFFKECECEYGKLCESDIKGYESMYGERLGEPFAGYQDFAACVAQNKDKGNPNAYCGYIKHKVEDKKGTESVLPEDKNPNTILFIDNTGIGRQRPEETNLLNNEPQQGISNQDPPNVEKPIMNVMSAGFIDDNKGKGPTSVGGTPEKGRVDQTMSGNTAKPELDEHKLVTQQETGVTGSMGAETENKNPIDEGLNKVDGPMNPKSQSSYVQNKHECEKLVESAIDPNKPAEGAAPIQGAAPIPDPKLVEAEKKLTESAVTITQLQAEKTALMTEKTVLDARVKELEPVVNKLQEAAKTFDRTTKEAVEKARKEGKEEIIKKVQKVLPANSMVSGNLQGCYRVLTNDIKKVLHEAEIDL
jgi:hypothetical protein